MHIIVYMETVHSFFTTAPGIALIISAIIFLITIILVSARVINFWTTLLLLLFSLLSGLTISNFSAFREYLQCKSAQQQLEVKFDNFSQEVTERLDQLEAKENALETDESSEEPLEDS